MNRANQPQLSSPARRFGFRPSRPGGAQGGFTLLEILVALVILALSLGILLQLLSRNLQSVSQSEAYTRAVMLARMKMEELLVREAPVPAILQGELEGGYAWSARWRATDLAGEAGSLKPFELSVVVQWGQGTAPKQLGLSTIKLFSMPEQAP